jgi:hypothetical protein
LQSYGPCHGSSVGAILHSSLLRHTIAAIDNDRASAEYDANSDHDREEDHHEQTPEMLGTASVAERVNPGALDDAEPTHGKLPRKAMTGWKV